MAFLGFGKRKRAATGTEKERRDKLKNDKEALVLDALKDLKESGDPRFFDLVARQAGLPAQSHSDLDEFFDRYEKFQKLSQKAQGRDGIAGQIGEAAKVVEPLVQRLMGGPSAPIQIQVPVGYKLVPIEQPSRIEAPSAAPTPEPASTAPAAASPTVEVPMSPLSIQVINILGGMTPHQGAAWLLEQNAGFAKWLIDAVCKTPDDGLPELLAGLAIQVPDFAGVVAWLQARPDWFGEFVRAVRDAKKKWPAQAVVGSSA